MKCELCNKKFHKYTNQGGYVDNIWCCNYCINFQPKRSKREDCKVTTITSYECPKIEMPIDKDILTKYK